MAAKSASRTAPTARIRARKSSERSKRPEWVRRLKLGLTWGAILFSIVFIVFGAMFYKELQWAAAYLPKVESYIQSLASNPSVIVSSDGKILFRAQVEYRKPAKFEDIPEVLKDATLAAEDSRFYDHSGVDWWAISRAAFVNVKEGRVAEGGSTLTMQLAKRIQRDTSKSFQRKVRDMALAVQIEKTHSKDQILTLYLNQVYYGSGAYGSGAAASVYFNKKIQDLSLAEAALLARIVQRPSQNNPFDNPKVALENRHIVLGRMLSEGMISRSQYEEADSEPVKLQPRHFDSGSRSIRSKYFVDYVLDTIRRDFPEIDFTKGGYRIETTLDTRLDDVAQAKVQEVVKKYATKKVTTGAFVLLDNQGRILAMVGGVDHKRNEYNVVFQGHRQPGSAFKPFVYAAALSTGAISPHDRISNDQLVIEDPVKGTIRWPKNAKPNYGGTLSIGSALAGSINVCAARVCQIAGPTTVARYARDVFGFRSELDPVLALALGSSAVEPLEMAQGYGVFMLRGDRAKPYGIARVIGPDGEVLREYGPEITRGVLDPRVAGWMDGYLRGVVTGGTATRAKVIPNARGKTGTTSDHRDAWFCGYTNSMVGIGWVANEHYDGRQWVYDPMSRVFGGRVTIEIWVGVMKEAVKLYAANEKERGKDIIPPKEEIVPPVGEPPIDDAAGTDTKTITPPPDPGAATTGGDTTVGEGTTPPTTNSNPVKEPIPAEMVEVEVCAESGKVANPYCPETVTRRFPRGKEPAARCHLHGPTQ